MSKDLIRLGDILEFAGKDSYFKGEVVSLFTKLNNTSVRCAVEDERGLLLIKDPAKGVKCKR